MLKKTIKIVLSSFFLMLVVCSNNQQSQVSGLVSENQSIAVAVSLPCSQNSSSVDSLSKAIAVISGADIDTIKANLSIGSCKVTGIVKNIPSGLNRSIELKIYDNHNQAVYYGTAKFDVQAGITINVELKLHHLTGSINISATICDTVVDNDSATYFQKDTSTIALWYFNEGGTDTIVKDYAGNHDLSFVNHPQWTAGQFGQALNFKNSNCITPYNVDLFPSNSITVEALVYIDSLPSVASPRSHSMIVSNQKWDSGDYGARGYELRLTDTDGKVEFVFGDQDSWHSAISEKKVTPGKWYKIAGQYDGKQISVYVNGELWALSNYVGKIQPSLSSTTIARRVDDQPFYFHGSIDEIRISSITRY